MQNSVNIESLKSLIDPEKITKEVIEVGEEWAGLDAGASSLEETKKTLLAKLTLEYKEASRPGGIGEAPAKKMSVAEAELKALTDPRYEAHLEQMVKAREEANRARVKYDLGKMKIELIRSLQATLRSEMNLAR